MWSNRNWHAMLMRLQMNNHVGKTAQSIKVKDINIFDLASPVIGYKLEIILPVCKSISEWEVSKKCL